MQQDKIGVYLKKVEVSKRKQLERILTLAKQLVPDAQEAIVYGMPTLKYQGTPFLGFDAHKRHIGVYPYSGHVIDKLKDDLRGYGLTKGAIQIPLDRPISKSLLEKVIAKRLAAIKEQSKMTAAPSRARASSRVRKKSK